MMEMVKTNPFHALFVDAEDGGYPKSEMGYIRAYFRDGRWYNTCFPVGEFNKSMASEFDQIYNRFTQLCPTLGKMRDMCKEDAKLIGDWCGYDQYEAYLETPRSLYRFIMRFTPGDYNLYLHCYDRFKIPWSDRQKIIDRVVENYECDDVELSTGHFDFNVSMEKNDLLSIFAEVQDRINGDTVVYPDTKGKFTGSFKDFLESCNGKEGYERFCYTDGSKVDLFAW